MKRFLLFHGHVYYPSGGANDLIGDFDSIELAVIEVDNYVRDNRIYDDMDTEWYNRWAHIYDMQEKKIVWDR